MIAAMVVPLVVALGGSVSAGYGLASPATQNYAARYAARVRGRLVNLAEAGAQCDGIAEHQVPTMPAGAAVVILDCGTNDIGGFGYTPEGKPDGSKRTAAANDAELIEAEKSFDRALAMIRRREPHATIYLVNVRHWQRMTGPEAPQFARDVDAWNAMLAGAHARVVDIANDPRMYAERYILPDLVHPNAAGNVAIASDFR